MKKNAFTLVELLAVITILSIIAIITVPNIVNIINDSKTKLNESQKQIIIAAARNYGTKNITLINENPSQNSISLQTLKDQGYLDDKEVKDIITKNELKGKICVTWENNQFVYEYQEEGDC